MLCEPFSSAAPAALSIPTRRCRGWLNSIVTRPPGSNTKGHVIPSATMPTHCSWRSRFGSRPSGTTRSEEHTSELQSLAYLVCRLLLEKKKKETRVWYSSAERYL